MSTPHLPTAGIRRRLASMFYELLLLIGVVGVLIVPLILFSTATRTAITIPFLRAYLFLLLAPYFIWHWQGGRQTLAMKTWKLRLVAHDDKPPRPLRLALRYVLAWPSIGLGGVGILWAVFDRDHQFLHDRLAGTRLVIDAPPTTASPPQPAGT